MTTVKIYTQDFGIGNRPGYQFFTSDWELPRKHVYTYLTDKKGVEACEEAFHIFNAPIELLEEWQQYIAKAYKGTSLSVGDVVEVDGVEHICCSLGWEKKEEDSVAIA